MFFFQKQHVYNPNSVLFFLPLSSPPCCSFPLCSPRWIETAPAHGLLRARSRRRNAWGHGGPRGRSRWVRRRRCPCGKPRAAVWLQILHSLKLTTFLPLKIGRKPNRKGLYSNHPFSGAKMLVSGRVSVFPNGVPNLKKVNLPWG